LPNDSSFGQKAKNVHNSVNYITNTIPCQYKIAFFPIVALIQTKRTLPLTADCYQDTYSNELTLAFDTGITEPYSAWILP
jgi:hypothetical protein